MEAMNEVQRHFATGVYVVDRSGGEPRVLLLKHKKIRSWLPPGGHLEENELPHEGALRELEEETGLKAVLAGGNEPEKMKPNAWMLPSPHHMQLEEIEPRTHYHIDFVYFATPQGSTEIIDNENHGQIRWFTQDELMIIPEEDIFIEARKWALEALEWSLASGEVI